MATSTFIPPTFTPILQTLTSRNSIAMVGLLSYTPKTLRPLSYAQSYGFSSLLTARKLLQFQVRSVATPTEAVARFEEMLAGTHRKYYMLGSKGGVGKTSCAASLAVKFANNRHPTLVVSTDPAHSLSDSFAQDLTGGTLVPVDGPDAPLFCSGAIVVPSLDSLDLNKNSNGDTTEEEAGCNFFTYTSVRESYHTANEPCEDLVKTRTIIQRLQSFRL